MTASCAPPATALIVSEPPSWAICVSPESSAGIPVELAMKSTSTVRLCCWKKPPSSASHSGTFDAINSLYELLSEAAGPVRIGAAAAGEGDATTPGEAAATTAGDAEGLATAAGELDGLAAAGLSAGGAVAGDAGAAVGTAVGAGAWHAAVRTITPGNNFNVERRVNIMSVRHSIGSRTEYAEATAQVKPHPTEVVARVSDQPSQFHGAD